MSEIVDCYSGWSYPERPRAFFWEGEHLAVDRVLDAWRTPGEIHYRVRTRQGQFFDLHYFEVNEKWWITAVILTSTGHEHK